MRGVCSRADCCNTNRAICPHFAGKGAFRRPAEGSGQNDEKIDLYSPRSADAGRARLCGHRRGARGRGRGQLQRLRRRRRRRLRRRRLRRLRLRRFCLPLRLAVFLLRRPVRGHPHRAADRFSGHSLEYEARTPRAPRPVCACAAARGVHGVHGQQRRRRSGGARGGGRGVFDGRLSVRGGDGVRQAAIRVDGARLGVHPSV